MATTADDVWRLLGELAEAQKETERLLKEQSQEAERRFQEAERRFQETEQILKDQARKTDRQIQQVNQQIGNLGNRLGEFVEWQVRPAAVRLFRERGIAVRQLASDVTIEAGEDSLEIDLLVVNGDEAVAVEVKSKLSQTDVNEHLERIAKFRRLSPQHRSMKLMGAVAGMVVPPEVARYAYHQGLFVLAQSGDSMVILNDDKFKAKTW
ncbi:hypothetical protein L3556_00655 [Candidatus Synechococcus calcipolaris G9]|uniref:DUF3782 domain-containing protein n=1 Tax=Candidatus Synechococcus calcipolaris G9 TaxID=1497997 RepID=A0ABT6EU82_9SYNE|nr:hypothetical protein [Candidatus Synechococcus calcipolaris]MDG2989447.1 hypothetical protein [Candidatus Synechococcus calcipolaris G9]